MFETMLIALDGTDFSARAIPVGAELARRGAAELRAVAIAHNDAELAMLYDHVHAVTDAVGIDPAAVDVIVDPKPAKMLLDRTVDDRTVLCFATHDRPKPVSKALHSVGADIIENSTRPVLVVGTNASVTSPGSDVVVALDGVDDPEPVLGVAAAWARQLQADLRIVTVYEPVPADLRRPEHYSRHHGPSGDPDAYLAAVAERLGDVGATHVETVAIADPVGVAPGLEAHLRERPGALLVLGGGDTRRPHVHPGVAHDVLELVPVPVLLVNRSV